LHFLILVTKLDKVGKYQLKQNNTCEILGKNLIESEPNGCNIITYGNFTMKSPLKLQYSNQNILKNLKIICKD
jgi:hypothetical protein